MSKRRIYDSERHVHFVTFSCYKRRRLLDHDRPKRIVLGTLNQQLRRLHGRCVGFVVMPNHVHVIVWFPADNQLGEFLEQWKRLSSHRIKGFIASQLRGYGKFLDPQEPIWQAKHYDFNLHSRDKIEQKLTYMHQNPVRAGLVQSACDWPWSSARYYELGRPVGVPVAWIE